MENFSFVSLSRSKLTTREFSELPQPHIHLLVSLLNELASGRIQTDTVKELVPYGKFDGLNSLPEVRYESDEKRIALPRTPSETYESPALSCARHRRDGLASKPISCMSLSSNG